MSTNTETSSHSLIGLLQTLRDESTTLLRQEVALAKAEIAENVTRAGKNAASIAVGALVAYAGGIVLLIGLGLLLGTALVRAGIDEDLSQWLAPAIVGAVVILIGWAMVAKAKRALATHNLAPRETIESLRTDKQWAAAKLQNTQ